MGRVSSDPLDWIEYPPPYFDLEAANRIPASWSYNEPNLANYCARSSRFSWKLYLENGNARVKLRESDNFFCDYRDIYYFPANSAPLPPFPDVDTTDTDVPEYGERHILKVSDGWLVGYNHGEFGANIWWFSDNGREKYKISDEHIVAFFIWNDRIYALEGLAHLCNKEGMIITISQDADNKWASSVFAELPEVPAASVMRKGNLYVVTSDSLIVKVAGNGTVSNIVENGFWWSLYPTSIVIDQNWNAFIGMRQGVAMCSIGKQEPELKWLVPSERYMRQEFINFRRNVSRMGYFVDYDFPDLLDRAHRRGAQTWRKIQRYLGHQ
jgi:hypothetical protein